MNLLHRVSCVGFFGAMFVASPLSLADDQPLWFADSPRALEAGQRSP